MSLVDVVYSTNDHGTVEKSIVYFLWQAKNFMARFDSVETPKTRLWLVWFDNCRDSFVYLLFMLIDDDNENVLFFSRLFFRTYFRSWMNSSSFPRDRDSRTRRVIDHFWTEEPPVTVTLTWQLWTRLSKQIDYCLLRQRELDLRKSAQHFLFSLQTRDRSDILGSKRRIVPTSIDILEDEDVGVLLEGESDCFD